MGPGAAGLGPGATGVAAVAAAAVSVGPGDGLIGGQSESLANPNHWSIRATGDLCPGPALARPPGVVTEEEEELY